MIPASTFGVWKFSWTTSIRFIMWSENAKVLVACVDTLKLSEEDEEERRREDEEERRREDEGEEAEEEEEEVPAKSHVASRKVVFHGLSADVILAISAEKKRKEIEEDNPIAASVNKKNKKN